MVTFYCNSLSLITNPPIPPFATLIFDVEIVDVKKAAGQGQANALIQNNAPATQQLQGNVQATQTAGQTAVSGQIGGQIGQTALNFPAQATGAGLMGQTGGIQTGMVGTRFGTQAANPLATQQQTQLFNQANLIQQLNAASAAGGVQQQPQQQFIAQPGSQTFNALNSLQAQQQQQQQFLAAQTPQQQFAAQPIMQQQPQFAQTVGVQQQQASQQIGMGVGQPRGMGLPAANTNFMSQVGQPGLGIGAGNTQLMGASG